MKILTILGSPHGEGGATYELLTKVLEGCEEEGAKTEIIILSDKKVLYCVGCANCLMEGNCRIRDDVPEIHQKMKEADGIIFASPVYLGGVTGQMKTFLDRCLPIGHRPELHGKYGVSVVVSGGIFDEQTAHYLISALAAFGLSPVGSICGVAVSPGMFEKPDVVFAHAKRLGKQLAVAIKEKHQYATTGEELRSQAFFRDLIIKYKGFFEKDYEYWKEKGWLKRPGDAEEESGEPSSSAGKTHDEMISEIREMFEIMPTGFNAEEAKKLKATIQFEINSGEQTLHWFFRIENRECQGEEGLVEDPTLKITSSAADWLALADGTLSGGKAFLTGRIKAQGKMRLMMKFDKLFPREA